MKGDGSNIWARKGGPLNFGFCTYMCPRLFISPDVEVHPMNRQTWVNEMRLTPALDWKLAPFVFFFFFFFLRTKYTWLIKARRWKIGMTCMRQLPRLSLQAYPVSEQNRYGKKKKKKKRPNGDCQQFDEVLSFAVPQFCMFSSFDPSSEPWAFIKLSVWLR